jgi:hypothetical protein
MRSKLLNNFKDYLNNKNPVTLRSYGIDFLFYFTVTVAYLSVSKLFESTDVIL